MTQKEDRKPAIGKTVAELASRQHGVVSREQLRALGLTDTMIASRIAAGALLRVFPAVYGVGHLAIGRHSLMLAAVLACGEGAVVSHGSAAELHRLWDRRPALIDVIAPGKRGRGLDGVRWHRGYPLEPDEVTARERIPCTAVSRTLVDMAGSVGERSLRRLVEQAVVLRELDVAEVDLVLSRRRRRGAPILRRVLAPWRGNAGRPPKLRSVLEARLFAAIADAGLPRPRCNAVLRLEGHRLEVDFLWDEQRLVVETDGETTHRTAAAFQRDRWRDQLLGAAGYRPVRVTWSQMEEEPEATVARIGRMLERAA
jgi:very-short-patch-repair endonuclease/predicted transcriptional regulator of viral defense system